MVIRCYAAKRILAIMYLDTGTTEHMKTVGMVGIRSNQYFTKKWKVLKKSHSNPNFTIFLLLLKLWYCSLFYLLVGIFIIQSLLSTNLENIPPGLSYVGVVGPVGERRQAVIYRSSYHHHIFKPFQKRPHANKVVHSTSFHPFSSPFLHSTFFYKSVPILLPNFW